MGKVYHLDYETRSQCDLPSCGGWRYAFDPTTEILCIGVAEEAGEPVVWTPWNRDARAVRMMRDFADPETVIYAHNATGFEVPVTDALFTKTTGLKAPQHHQWRCTAAMGRRAALPASLKRLAEALKLANQKDDKGASLIRKFSIPNAKTGVWVEPEDDWEAFQQFCDYCRQDVKVEQEIHQKLKAFELKGFPLQVFQLDLEINARGFPVNLDALRKAQVIVEQESAVIAKQFEALTGLSPNQNAKFLAWLKERGYERENLQSGTLEEVLDLCKGKIQLNIEIKPNAATPELEAETVRIIREKGFEKDCAITSQSYETLCKVKELDPEIETGYILALGVGTYYDLPAADFFSVESTFITSGMVQQIHLRGKTVSAWTVNRTEDARALLSLGVDDVITDKPEMVQELLNEDADLDRNLVLMRDRLKELLGLTESADSEVDPDDSAIEEVLEDPEELLDQA